MRGPGHWGFIQQVREFIHTYQPGIIFLMETKVNSNRAKNIIQKFSFNVPFFMEIPSVGLTVVFGSYGEILLISNFIS